MSTGTPSHNGASDQVPGSAMIPGPSVLDISGHFGTPSRDVAHRVCSTPIVVGDSWSDPSDQSSEDNSSFLDTLDDFLEELGTFLKSSSTSSTEQSISPLVADDDGNDVLDNADFLTSADQDSDIGCAPLDNTLPLGSSHLDVPEISKLTQASHRISIKNGDAYPLSICSLDATQDFDHPPDSNKSEDSNKGALQDARQPLSIYAGLQVTQAHKSSPLIISPNQDSDEDFFLSAENSNDNPQLDLPLTTPAQAHGSAPLPRFQNEASDEDCLLNDSSPLVFPGASQSYKYSADCHLVIHDECGMAPVLGYSQFNGNHPGMPNLDSKEHESAFVEDVPQFTTAYFLDAFHTWEDHENCQGFSSKTQTLAAFAAHDPYSIGSASIAELPASSNKNEIANISSMQTHSYKHSTVFFTGIPDSADQDDPAVDAVCIDPEAHTEDIEHIPTKDDNVVLLVAHEPDDIGGWTPAASTGLEEQDSPACSVKSTDTLVIGVDNGDLTIIAEDSPEQDKTLVISDSPAAGHDPREGMSMAVTSHQIKSPLKNAMEPRSVPSFDLRDRINNIRSSSASHATGGSSIKSKSYCSNAHYIAEAECSKQQASSSFTIPHLHDQPPCSSKVASSFQALDFEQTSQKPQTSAAAASRRAPFLSEDPEENNDNAHPEWERLRRLTTDEERYEAVRNVWHNSTVPNPHCVLTTFHYRRQALRVQGIRNTPAPKQHKRKASHNPGRRRPAKRQRMDTDVFDLKLKVLERKRDHDFLKSQLDFERNLGELRSSAHQNRWQSDFEHGSKSRHCKHRRANTVPWDFGYFQQEQERLHAQFKAEQDTIHHKYFAKQNKLLSAREEVRRFDKFYVGLQQADPRRLTEEQLKDQLNLEKLLGYFGLWYKNAKD